MENDADQMLIRAYARERCERSFGELVHRHVDLVHSTALRVLRDPSLAEDVTQRVFLELARHAAKLQERSSLTGWLYETTRNLAINTVRGEERRRHREHEASSMSNLQVNESEAVWMQVAPYLDEALAQLDSIERDVILWRYFERRTAEQIGGRLGLTAEAAQKRVARALDRLRGIFAERGLATSTATLSLLLSTHAVQSAPVGLAASAIAAASTVTASTLLPATSTIQLIMASTKAKLALTALLAASVTTPLVLQHQTNKQLQTEIQSLRAQLTAQAPSQPSVVDVAELQRLRNEHDELLRLRGQATQLRQQLANQPKPQGNMKKFEGKRDFGEEENAGTLLAKSPEVPMVQVGSLTNAGYATPLASLQTMHWAVENRDTNAVMSTVGLEPEARRRADEIFAQLPESVREKYGSVDALLVDWRMNLSENAQSYRVLSHRDEDPNSAFLTVQFQYPSGRVRENEIPFYRDEQGTWRAALQPQVMDKLPHIVNGQDQPGQEQSVAGK